MIKHKIHIGGAEVDLALSAAEIETVINEKLDKCYLGLVKVSYMEIDERTAEFTFHRDLPYDYYGVLNGCVGQIDAAIISGLTENCFEVDFITGKSKPVCGPLIPWGKSWFVPDAAFYAFYRQFVETMTGEKLARVKILALSDQIKVTVKYPRSKGKYNDDVADLEAELGGTLESHRGETLTFKLYDLGQICQRPQVKVKSYMGLVSYLLKTYEITLKII